MENTGQEIINKLATQEKKLDEVYRSVEQMRKYFLWTLMITVAVIVLPLIGLFFVIPQFLNSYNLNGL